MLTSDRKHQSGARRDVDLDALADRYADRTCLPFAGRLARRYRGRGEPLEDLEQVAGLGLVKAIDRFDPQRGSFTAYAVLTICGEVKKHFRDRTWSIHVARRVQNLGIDARNARATLTSALNRVPTSAEIAAYLDVPVADLNEALRSSAGYSPASLNSPAAGETGTELGDLVGDLDTDLESVDDRVTVARLIRQLPPREQRMLALRFYGNRSQVEIAAELGVSQMHVSRLLRAALDWLREAMLSDNPPPWHGGDPLVHSLRVTVDTRAGTLVIGVRGEVDRDTAAQLRCALDRAVATAVCDTVVLDLGRVPLIDAAGVSVVLDAARAASVAGRSLVVTNVRPTVARVLAATGLDHLTA